METVVHCSENPAFTWIDVYGPEPAELLDLARRYGLHQTSVEDCLDPEHLPKHERIGETTFLILRVFDPAAPDRAASVQELTRKIALFLRQDLAITIHRVDLPLIRDLRERFSGHGPESACTPLELLTALVRGGLASYEKPLATAEDSLDQFEEELFHGRARGPALPRIHQLKRRVSLIRRMLWQTTSVIQRLTPTGERTQPVYQDLRETAEGYHFWADELLEEVNNLLAMYVTMASHRTNEVMRVLTVFSAFFLPLTFIVGVYGMNFDWMPELPQRWGYPAVLGLMAGVSLVIFVWFRRRGWLRRARD
ncbi:MAG: magnesium transporter CorA family protein [Gemmatimonadales bacterium]